MLLNLLKKKKRNKDSKNLIQNFNSKNEDRSDASRKFDDDDLQESLDENPIQKNRKIIWSDLVEERRNLFARPIHAGNISTNIIADYLVTHFASQNCHSTPITRDLPKLVVARKLKIFSKIS